MMRIIFEILIGTLCSFISILYKLDNKKIVITSTHNNSYNFNSSPIFEHLTNKGANFDVYYVMNDKIKRNELSATHGDFFISNTSLKGIFHMFSAKVWVSSTFELPLLTLFRNKKRIVLHLGHGVPLKKIGLRESKISFFQRLNRYLRVFQFTDVVCYSSYLENDMKLVFGNTTKRYIPLGQPRNDLLNIPKEFSRINILNCVNNSDVSINSRFVLYAPTWRPYSDTLLFPFSDFDEVQFKKFLIEKDVYIFVRSHPFYPAILPEGMSFGDRVIDFDNKILNDINSVLSGFDVLLTDYSSIYIDFLKLGRLGFIPYDLESYSSTVGFAIDYNEFTPGPKIKTMAGFLEFIVEGVDSYKKQRESLSEITNTKYTGNCDEVISYIIERTSSNQG